LQSFQNPSFNEGVVFSETLPGSQREGTGQRGIEFKRIELQKLFDIGEFHAEGIGHLLEGDLTPDHIGALEITESRQVGIDPEGRGCIFQTAEGPTRQGERGSRQEESETDQMISANRS